MPKPRILSVSLLLFGGILPGAGRADCDAPTTTLRTELEDLQEVRSRLIVDFPPGPYGPRRLMYVENRSTSGCGSSGCGDSDQGDSGQGDSDREDPDWGGGYPVLQPQRWAVGFASTLITAGPVSLRGILAQAYNPLAHGPTSDVFSEPPDLSLNIDLDVAARRGIQLGLIPGRWTVLCIYEKRIGAQLGSTIRIPLGRNLDLSLAGLLSSPPDRLGHEQSWYAEGPLFPGGLITHLAGSLTWDHDPLRLTLVAAAAAGRLVRPGTYLTVDMGLSASPVVLALLFGFCSPRYFTPEGDTGALEWIAAARADTDFGPIRLSAACSRELCPLPPFPDVFRGGRDQIDAGIEIVLRSAPRRLWSIEGEVALQRQWSAEGRESSFRCLEARSNLDWSAWSFAVGMSELRDGESESVRSIGMTVGHDPAWGKVELEAGYRLSPTPGFDLTAAFDATGEHKRFYIRVGTKGMVPAPALGDSLQAGDWLEHFTLKLGWEASTDWQFRRQSR
jgi:hypothetical protein